MYPQIKDIRSTRDKSTTNVHAGANDQLQFILQYIAHHRQIMMQVNTIRLL
jgi:hypothetical protein